MATNQDAKVPEENVYQVPEWEHSNPGGYSDQSKPGRTRGSIKITLIETFNSILPANRKYMRLSRNRFVLALLGAFLALLALIVGLSVGLTKHSGSDSDLPLPSNTKAFTGDLTYFEPGLGACGETDTSSDMIVALSHLLFDAAGSTSANGGNSNMNPLCNKMVRAQRYNEEVGKMQSVDLKVVDRCVGCAVDDLDTTESAFAQLAPIASGRVDVTWAWLQPVATGK